MKGERSISRSRSKARLLAGGIAVTALLAVGGGAVYAQGQESSMMGGDTAKSETDGNGMGGMINGGMMGGQGGTGSMMGEQGMSGGQMMGSFDEEQPFDLQFIDQMIPHHEGALMSSEHMISNSKRPELRQLYENIQKSQSEQIEQMQEWRKEWYPDAGQPSEMMGDGQRISMMENGMMGGSMQGMMGGSALSALDTMFLKMMIPHHQMAVDMSDEALSKAEHAELRDLAQKIRDEQSSEIELMQGYLDEIEAATGG